jgi:hypothetical protein
MPVYDTEDDLDNIDVFELIRDLKRAEVTTLNIGNGLGSLNLSVFDGGLTRNVLAAALKLIAKQGLKLEEYEETIRAYKKNDIAAVNRRLHTAESQIKNLGEEEVSWTRTRKCVGCSQSISGCRYR